MATSGINSNDDDFIFQGKGVLYIISQGKLGS